MMRIPASVPLVAGVFLILAGTGAVQWVRMHEVSGRVPTREWKRGWRTREVAVSVPPEPMDAERAARIAAARERARTRAPADSGGELGTPPVAASAPGPEPRVEYRSETIGPSLSDVFIAGWASISLGAACAALAITRRWPAPSAGNTVSSAIALSHQPPLGRQIQYSGDRGRPGPD
jgi:hypothetical protein